MKSLLLKNGTVVTSSQERVVDLLIQDGKIVEMGLDLAASAPSSVEVIDCSELHILPGVIDGHVHLRTPGEEHKEDWTTGTQAAAAGGVTMVVDMPNNVPPITTRALLEQKRQLIRGRSYVNYGFYMGAHWEEGHTNIEDYLASEALALKVYMGSSTGSLLIDRTEALDQIFEAAAKQDRLICVHAEDAELLRERMALFQSQNDPAVHSQIRNDEVAYRAVKKALHLAKKYNTRLHICHLSSRRELEEFKAFQSPRISCEVTPHHLFLTEKELATQGNLAKMNPPLRTDDDRETLWEGIRSGLVTSVATDHAPHTIEEKSHPYSQAPAGVPGLETMLPILLDGVNHGQLTLRDVVQVTSEGPARVFGLDQQGMGGVKVGEVANLVVVDMMLEQTVQRGGPGARFSKGRWSVFEGRTFQGWPIMTIVNGEMIFEKDRIVGQPRGQEFRF